MPKGWELVRIFETLGTYVGINSTVSLPLDLINAESDLIKIIENGCVLLGQELLNSQNNINMY